MPGFNVLVKFPHGEETVFADVDAPSCKTVYTGWDGRKWKVTRFKTRKSHVDGHDTDFEAVVEDITPDEAA